MFSVSYILNSYLYGGMVMGGIVIAFPRTRAGAYCTKAKKSSLRARRRRPQLKVQVERITALLEELEDISSNSSEVPSAILTRARASICKVEEMLGPGCAGHLAARALVEDEGAAQPHIDRKSLERHFRSLDPYQ